MAVKYEDYYKVLGIERSATSKDVQTAYRKLARKYHPDVNKAPDAEEKFKRINEAYEVLKDSEKRKLYDELGANWKEGQDFRPPPGWSQTYSTRSGGGGFKQAEFEGFSDFFDMFFGGSGRSGSPFEGAFGQNANYGRHVEWQMQGEDINSELSLTAEEIYEGGIKKIILTQTKYDNNGMPYQEKKEIDVKIPPGVTEGSKIRLKGQGDPGAGGGKPGDLLLRVHIISDGRFNVNGHDVETRVKIDLWDALLGATVDVRTLDNTIQMKIPAGTQPDQRFRVKGKGLRKNSTENGDLYVKVGIEIPKLSDEDDKKTIAKIAAKYRR